MLNLFSESIGLVHKPVWIIWSLFIDYLFIHIKLIIIIMPPSSFSSGLNITVSVLCKSMGKKSTSIVLSWHKISFFFFLLSLQKYVMGVNKWWHKSGISAHTVYIDVYMTLLNPCFSWCFCCGLSNVFFFFFFIINGFLLIFFFMYMMS